MRSTVPIREACAILRRVSPSESIASTTRRCLLNTEPPCEWTTHDYKHAAARGVERRDTRHGPARYRAMPQGEWHGLEMQTVRQPTHGRGSAQSGKTEYLRDVRSVIGWDEGEDATLSYVECSGGLVAGRAFHGRPMRAKNRTARSMQQEET